MNRPVITLTRPDGERVCIFVDSIAMVEPPIDGESNGHSKVMISGTYRWFEETVDTVMKLLQEH